MNMSYCKFENTLRDLLDCETTLTELKHGEEDHLSPSEVKAAKGLVAACLRVVELLVDNGVANSTSDADVTEEFLFDQVDSMNEDVKHNRKRCDNCGEMFTTCYEGQILCGQAGDEGCVDPDAPDFESEA